MATMRREANANEENTCPICLETFSTSNPPMETECCKNPFHFTCILRWRKKKNSCPFVCDQPLNIMKLKRVDQDHLSDQTRKRKYDDGHFSTISSKKIPSFKKQTTRPNHRPKPAKLSSEMSDEELNELLLKWRKDGLLRPAIAICRFPNIASPYFFVKQRSIVERMYTRLFEEYPQDPHYNDEERDDDCLIGEEAYHGALWSEFVKLLVDVAGFSENDPISTIAEKIVKAERLGDEIGFDVSVILARLKCLVYTKKEKLQVQVGKMKAKLANVEKELENVEEQVMLIQFTS